LNTSMVLSSVPLFGSLLILTCAPTAAFLPLLPSNIIVPKDPLQYTTTIGTAQPHSSFRGTIRRRRQQPFFASSDGGEDEPDDENDKDDSGIDGYFKKLLSEPIVEVQLAVLVILSSLLVGLGTLQNLPPPAALLIGYAEFAITATFSAEYFVRWRLANFSFKYVVQPLAIIDFIAILPALLMIVSMLGVPVPPNFTESALINLRLLRILRLQRILTNYETFRNLELALGLSPSDTRPYQLQLARVVISIYTVLSVTSGLIYSAEHKLNPNIPDYFTALYFALTTLTTVGFGDINPVTTSGRWVVSGSILVGIAVIPAQTAALVSALLDRYGEGESTDVDDNVDGNFSVAARLQRLELKLDQTNVRIDRVLQVLEHGEDKLLSSDAQVAEDFFAKHEAEVLPNTFANEHAVFRESIIKSSMEHGEDELYSDSQVSEDLLAKAEVGEQPNPVANDHTVFRDYTVKSSRTNSITSDQSELSHALACWVDVFR